MNDVHGAVRRLVEEAGRDRSENHNPSLPKPATVAITRLPRAADGLNVIPRP